MPDIDDVDLDALHPLTQQILSRRGFLGTAGKAAATVTFMGMTMSVIGCSKDETTTGTGTGSTTKPAGGSSSTTAAAGGSTTSKATGSSMAGTKTLYEELGGNKAITAVVGIFLKNVLADDVIKARFAKTDGADLSKKLVDQIGEATGGPEKYTGLSMKDAHKGMKITVAEFNALVGDLGKALTEAGVSPAIQGKLVEALAPMQADIVGQ